MPTHDPLPEQRPPPPVQRLDLPQDENGRYTMPSMPPPQDLAKPYNPQVHADGDGPAWAAFQELQKQLTAAHSRTMQLHQQISNTQLTHEKEAADQRVAAQQQIDHLRKELETTTEHYTQCQAKLDNLTGLLHRKAEQILKLEQQVHEANHEKATAIQNACHSEDKARIIDSQRQLAEVRQKELELSLEHSTSLVNSLRKQLYVANDDKVAALQQQYQQLEENRKELIAFYAQREAHLLQNYNDSLRTVQAMTDDHVRQREQAIAAQWEKTIESLTAQYKILEAEVLSTASRHQQEKEDLQAKAELDKEKWISHLKSEMELMEKRHLEREEHVLADIARRERELAEREQQQRVQLAREQQEAKIALMTKEAEMKAYYEKIIEDLRNGADSDRQKLMAGFREEITALSRQHESNERELERLHRDKEREMAQRYRIAGYEVDDTKKQVDMQNVTNKTQSSLLAKFEAVERSQRERAEVSRLSLKGQTSLSGVGLGSTTSARSSTVTTPPNASSPTTSNSATQ